VLFEVGLEGQAGACPRASGGAGRVRRRRGERWRAPRPPWREPGRIGRIGFRVGEKVSGLILRPIVSMSRRLLDVDTALQLSRFMGYVASNIAKEVSRRHGWKDKIWSRRYQAIAAGGPNRLPHAWSSGIGWNLSWAAQRPGNRAFWSVGAAWVGRFQRGLAFRRSLTFSMTFSTLSIWARLNS
jgi:hypothetical protein